jgi:hypothetical protein
MWRRKPVEQFEQYWVSAAVCLVIGLFILRLVLHERITLQGSLSYLAFLAVLGLFTIFPEVTAWVAHRMGFELGSNFFFAICLGMLALLHLGALVALSRVEQRTITLTQELAIMQERLDTVASPRASFARERSGDASPAHQD